jgi:hypothetical protein
MYVGMYVCMYVAVYVCMYVAMYVCSYVWNPFDTPPLPVSNAMKKTVSRFGEFQEQRA